MAMARYEIVEEPEAMEIIDDGVYHPDLTVTSSSPSVGTFKSLEPIIAGPVSFKTIFYGSEWRYSKRRLFLGILVFLVLLAMAIFIMLISGLATTLARIREFDKMKRSGLFVVPKIISEAGLFLYNLPNSTNDAKALVDGYVAEIDEFLNAYENQTQFSVDCNTDQKPEKNKVCKYDLNWLGTNCTKSNKYGFYDGNPCILFGMRNLGKWTPEIAEYYLHSQSVANYVGNDRAKVLNSNHTPLSCFPRQVIFSTLHEAQFSLKLSYYPDAGFHNGLLTPPLPLSTKSLAPVIFVQLNQIYKDSHLRINCSALAKNINDLYGIRSLVFEYYSGDKELLLDD